ncbi:MAG: hypothetical protein ACE5OZ_11375 [Candidatus Heimdallarchaeota archaeon]
MLSSTEPIFRVVDDIVGKTLQEAILTACTEPIDAAKLDRTAARLQGHTWGPFLPPEKPPNPRTNDDQATGEVIQTDCQNCGRSLGWKLQQRSIMLPLPNETILVSYHCNRCNLGAKNRRMATVPDQCPTCSQLLNSIEVRQRDAPKKGICMVCINKLAPNRSRFETITRQLSNLPIDYEIDVPNDSCSCNRTSPIATASQPSSNLRLLTLPGTSIQCGACKEENVAGDHYCWLCELPLYYPLHVREALGQYCNTQCAEEHRQSQLEDRTTLSDYFISERMLELELFSLLSPKYYESIRAASNETRRTISPRMLRRLAADHERLVEELLNAGQNMLYRKGSMLIPNGEKAIRYEGGAYILPSVEKQPDFKAFAKAVRKAYDRRISRSLEGIRRTIVHRLRSKQILCGQCLEPAAIAFLSADDLRFGSPVEEKIVTTLVPNDLGELCSIESKVTEAGWGNMILHNTQGYCVAHMPTDLEKLRALEEVLEGGLARAWAIYQNEKRQQREAIRGQQIHTVKQHKKLLSAC